MFKKNEKNEKISPSTPQENNEMAPMIIKWYIYLQSKSSKAYEAMHETGFLSLPSRRTLYDYTHSMPLKMGFQIEYVDHLISEARARKMYDKDLSSYEGLLRDEMKIKEDLVYDKTTG